MMKRQPVELSDCQVKKARRGSRMELLLKGSSVVRSSVRQIDVSGIRFGIDVAGVVSVEDVCSRSVYDRVSLKMKVLSVRETVCVGKGKTKQDVVVGDSTCVVKFTLWEEAVGKRKVGESYLLENVIVMEYGGAKFVSMAKEGSRYVVIDDVGEIKDVELAVGVQESLREITDAKVVAVERLQEYKACLRCKGRVEPLSPPLGRCSKDDCGMLQEY